MKKIFKIIGVLILIIIVLLIAIPFFLESKIDTIVQNYANENLDADLSFDDISLSLISSFPKAEISVDNLKITNHAPFENETFASAKSFAFEMPMTELLKGTDEPLVINEIIANELLLTLKVNKNGTPNYDIVKSTEDTVDTLNSSESSSGFSFDIKNFEINNSAFTYIDETSDLNIGLTEFNHKSKGVFSGDKSELDTNTKAQLNFEMDSVNYINNTAIKLDALLDLNLAENKYTFKDNKGYINNLPIEFNGFVQLVENGQDVDITFKNPDATFKDFLAVLPEIYSKNIEDVKTSGKFTVNGKVKGLISDNTIPTLDINLVSDNASFKYPDLPKGVDNININASVKNETGNVDDTYIDLNKLDFKIDEDVFKSEAHIKDLTDNIKVNANIDGVLNLANITKAYPIELENQLTGILKGKLNTAFDMDAIESNTYQRIKNSGDVSVSDFVFSSEDIVNPIQINDAKINFKPGLVTLRNFDAQTGKSDFKATGTLNNLLGFLLSDKNLQGNFQVDSNMFAISDFMVEDETAKEASNKTTSNDESLKIPDFLECSISAKAKKVLYDNLTLNNVEGQLFIKDQNANLSNMTTDVFGGRLGISGNVSTKEKTPSFDMNLGVNDFNISQSFKDMKMLTALAPIAQVIEGKLNSTIDVSGLLDSNFSPNLNTITGNALAEVLTQNINTKNSALLSTLSSKLNFIDLEKLDLKDLKTKLSFENGQVAIEPFTIKYEDIEVEVGGSHSFTNEMNYDAVFNVPAKYLGSDVNRLIGQINDPEVDNITIPVTANIDGTFAKPNVKTDLTSSISNLTNQLVEIQKQKLIGKGKDKVNDLLGGLLGSGNSENTTSIDTSDVKNETTNSGATEDNVKKGVKNILGGLLGGKKNKKTQDSTENN